MRELLRSHKQDIIDHVVLHLRTLPNPQPAPTSPHPTLQYPAPGTQPGPANPTLVPIAELETQLAELRAAALPCQPIMESRAPGMFHPIQTPIALAGGNACGIVDSVETIFPGVERTTLVQIIENRFKPRNIYRLLASEKDRAETH